MPRAADDSPADLLRIAGSRYRRAVVWTADPTEPEGGGVRRVRAHRTAAM